MKEFARRCPVVAAGFFSGGWAGCFGLYRSCPSLIYFSMVCFCISSSDSCSSEASSSSSSLSSSYPLSSSSSSSLAACCSFCFAFALSYSSFSFWAALISLALLSSFYFLRMDSTSLMRFYWMRSYSLRFSYSCCFLVSSAFFVSSSLCFCRSRSFEDGVRAALPVGVALAGCWICF